MMVLVAIILTAFLVIQFVSLLALRVDPKHPKAEFDELPQISLLLAARNEEKNIIRSLNSIYNLDYPADKLQVLIGDDASTDGTLKLIQSFIKDKDNFSVLSIDSNLGNGRGKANVLAHLAHKAQGKFFFITDVDVMLPKGWVKSLLKEFSEEVGIVSGTTTCEPKSSIFSQLQSIDWLHFMGYIQSFGNLDVGCTSVGNNMAIRAKAYWETGGFEKIEFSITEDYKLFEAVTANGWQWRTIFSKGSLGLATHLESWTEMLHQRKRWLIGAKSLPFNWKFLITLYGLFIPAWIILVFAQPMFALALWGLKFVIQSMFIRRLHKLAGLKLPGLIHLLIYEAYVLLNTIMTFVFYILPIKAIWKGRVYSHNDLK